MVQNKTGQSVVGCLVKVWQRGRYGDFCTSARVIDYSAGSKKKKRTGRYLLRFKGTKNQNEFFDMWCAYSDFEIL